MPRIPFGLDRLPRTIALEDPRLRCATVGDEPLRLNTEPVPPDAMPLAIGDHAARVTAAMEWLIGLCGDYAPLRRRFIVSYFGFIAAHLDCHRAELVERLKPYDGLYAPEDFLWSALRPLPRAWTQAGDTLLPADVVFWDGRQAVAIELSPRVTENEAALRSAGLSVLRIEPRVLAGDPVLLGGLLPAQFQGFWDTQVLPSSPFRRAIRAEGLL